MDSIGYYYCGLRDHTGVIDFNGALRRSFNRLKHVDQHKWKSIIEKTGILDEEPSFSSLLESPSYPKFSEQMEKTSSGHKIFVFVLLCLLATVKERSLILFDEPEIHLHPNLLASLLRTLHSILEEQDSFAMIATHSPQVLQEVPAQYVRVICRDGDEALIKQYPGESFGANLGEISRHAFGIDEASMNFIRFLSDEDDPNILKRWKEETLRGPLSLATFSLLQKFIGKNEEP